MTDKMLSGRRRAALRNDGAAANPESLLLIR